MTEEKDKEIATLKRELQNLEHLAALGKTILEREQAFESRYAKLLEMEARANEMLNAAKEREELTLKKQNQYLEEIEVAQFQVRSLVELLKEKNKRTERSLQKSVNTGKMPPEVRDSLLRQLDREIKEALDKRPPKTKAPQKPIFTYSYSRKRRRSGKDSEI